MKAIDRIKNLLVSETNPDVKIITFKHGASGVKIRRKGYALYGSDTFNTQRMQYLVIEPCNYSNGDKWLFHGMLTKIIFGYSACHYAKNISQVIKALSK